MRAKTEGKKRIEIIESDQWIIRTSIVHNDIIHELGTVEFYQEKDCVNFVCNFFLANAVKKIDR